MLDDLLMYYDLFLLILNFILKYCLNKILLFFPFKIFCEVVTKSNVCLITNQ